MVSPSPTTYTPPSWPACQTHRFRSTTVAPGGLPPIATPPWDTKAPRCLAGTGGWVHGNVLGIGCGLGIYPINLARNGYQVTGLDALTTAKRRGQRRQVDVRNSQWVTPPPAFVHRDDFPGMFPLPRLKRRTKNEPRLAVP